MVAEYIQSLAKQPSGRTVMWVEGNIGITLTFSSRGQIPVAFTWCPRNSNDAATNMHSGADPGFPKVG